MRRGEVWWASLREPRGSDPGYRRPLVIVQANEFNQSAIRTVIAAVITTNLRLARAPGNVVLTRRETGLPNDSVANVSQLITVSKSFLTEKVGRIPARKVQQLNDGLRLVLSL